MFSNFRYPSGGGGGGATLDPAKGNYPLIGDFVYDGSITYTAKEVWKLIALSDGTIDSMAVDMAFPRTAGSLSLQLQVNDVNVSGAVLVIDGTNQSRDVMEGIAQAFSAGDKLSVVVTDSSYTPDSNIGQLSLLIQ